MLKKSRQCTNSALHLSTISQYMHLVLFYFLFWFPFLLHFFKKMKNKKQKAHVVTDTSAMYLFVVSSCCLAWRWLSFYPLCTYIMSHNLNFSLCVLSSTYLFFSFSFLFSLLFSFLPRILCCKNCLSWFRSFWYFLCFYLSIFFFLSESATISLGTSMFLCYVIILLLSFC